MFALNAGKERVDNYAEIIIKEAICVKSSERKCLFCYLKKLLSKNIIRNIQINIAIPKRT